MDREEFKLKLEKAAKVLLEAGAKEVYLFGSAKSESIDSVHDVDIAVLGLPPERYFGVFGDLMDIFQLPVDLVDLEENTPFHRHLKTNGELVRVA